MTKTIPNYLRIHRGSERNEVTQSNPQHDLIRNFWNSYSDATGWRIDPRASRNSSGLELLPAISSDTTDTGDAEPTTTMGRMSATRLANAASSLTDEVRRTRECLRQREAELASSAAMMSVEFDAKATADQIESALTDAMVACKCDAAALYMLDEDTQYLKARSVVGLPAQRLEDPPRQLRGSRADLEAMVHHTVAIDDFNAGSIDTWNCPEPFSAGICVAIKTDDVPIGTLWLFRNQVAEFGDAESAVARLVATCLSQLLQQSSQTDTTIGADSNQPIQDLSQWQYESLPVGSTLAQGWHVDGMIESPETWATGWHHWDVLPDGTLMLAIAEAIDPSAKGAMHAAIARAAVASHAGYRHTPSQLIQRVSDTLWQTSTGEQLVSLIYAHLDPDTGDGVVAAAGSIAALIGNRYGYRPLVDGSSDPLNTHMDSSTSCHEFHLMRGETMLAYSHGFVAAGGNQLLLGGHVRTAMQQEDRSPLAMLRRNLVDLPLTQERGALTLLRS